MTTPIYKSRAMVRVETRIGRPLEDWLAEQYQTRTQQQIADDLAERGLKVSAASVSRWMQELGIEARLPNQRPASEAVA